MYPTKGDRYKHKKRGTSYTIIGEARLNHRYPDMAVPHELHDGQMLVLYQGDDGVFSVRPVDHFMDGRFVRI